jgi:hypothetical protein
MITKFECEGVDYLDNTEAGCKAVLEAQREWQLRMVCGLRVAMITTGAYVYCADAFSLTDKQRQRGEHMAKAAKAIEVEITDRMASKFVKDIFAHIENIDSARSKFKTSERKEKDGMQAIYEGMASARCQSEVCKLSIKIIRALEKIKGWL